MGGENGISRGGLTLLGGSSPRGRGKRRMVLTTGWPVRLIPARAGKTITRTSSRSRRRAHPRAGGENEEARCLGRYHSGSSPRGRGKQIDLDWEDAGPGLIPARAGKTHHDQDQTVRLPAHPRAGGENGVVDIKSITRAGSSPRGRGKLGSSLQVEGHRRLIPARAGKTRERPTRRAVPTAHPRAGGENLFLKRTT